ncbi:Secretion system C-terminal sorting domain [Flavobacteriaceae bacterium]
MKKLYLFLVVLLSFTTTTIVAHAYTLNYYAPKNIKPGNVAALKGPNCNTTTAKNIVFFGARPATVAAPPDAPTAISPQVYAGTATIANLTATGTNLKWYTASTGETPLATTTSLIDGNTYYVSQTASGLESTRTAVVVRKISEASQIFCSSTTVAGLTSTPSAGHTTKWFTTATDGMALSSTDVPTTGTYYVEQSKDVPTTSSKLTEGSGSLSSIAIEADGKILIAEGILSGTVQRMDADGANVTTVATIANASSVAVQADGKILVADATTSLKRMDADGTGLVSFGTGLSFTTNVLVQPNGKILVIDDYKVKRMDADGTNLVTIADSFNLPYDLALQADGKIVVADTFNGLVKRMNADGSNIVTLGTGMIYPTAVEVMTDGKIIVTDDDKVKLIDIDGTTTEIFYTDADGGLISIAVTATGKIFVANNNNDNKFEINELVVGGTATSNRVAVSVNINASPTAPTASAQTFCNSGTVADLVATGTGTINWYTAATGGTALTASTTLVAGNYFASQTVGTCESAIRTSVAVTIAAAISTATGSQTNVSCNGGTNGSASVTPSGGAGGYTYSWSPSGGTAATATGLAAGTYTVTVTDANSCTAIRNFTITEPAAINFTTTVLSDYDYNTGYNQTIVASGGTELKTYAVTAGSLPSGFSLSSAGQITGISTQIADSNFTVTATDANSCTATYDYVLKLNQIPITVTATPSQTKVYGESDPVLTYTVSPSLLPGDSFTGFLTRVSGENIGNYAINQGSLSAGSKYLITYVGANFTITAKPITVTATPIQTKVYGTTDPAFAYTVSPSLIGGDSFTGALTRVAGENIGTYAINQASLSAGSNYTISYAGANFTVTAKPITVTATPTQTKVYGTTDPVFAYTVSPSLVSGDSFTGALTRAAGENADVYAITRGTLSAGGNYSITYISSNFTINKADQVITWNQTLAFGCNGETNIVLTAVSNSGLVVNYASSNANIASVSNNSLFFQNYGSTTITASQPGNMNYNAAPTVVLPVVTSQPQLIRKQFENIIFFDNSSKSFKSYSWYKNGVLVPSQTSQYFKENGALNGTYYAVATKLDGTLITTCTLTLSPTIEEEYIRIVPNPVRSNASFQLMTNVSTSRLQNARVELYNLQGNLLTTITNPSQNTIDMSAPRVEGIYIVKMTLANGKYFTKNLLVKN